MLTAFHIQPPCSAELRGLRAQPTPVDVVLPSPPSQCEEGVFDDDVLIGEAVPFQTFNGTAEIARAEVEWQYLVPINASKSVLLAPGYFAKEGIYDDVADFLAGQGLAVATYNAVRNQGRGAGWHPKHLMRPERLVCQAAWGAIRDIRKRPDIDGAPTSKFTIAGHSMGGRTAVKNALLHPDVVDGVVLVDPAGVANHSLGSLVLRIAEFSGSEVVSAVWNGDIAPRQAARHAINGLMYGASNPFRTVAEGVSIARSDIKPDIEELAERQINVALLLSPGDRLVHADESLDAAPEVMDVWTMQDKMSSPRNLQHFVSDLC